MLSLRVARTCLAVVLAAACTSSQDDAAPRHTAAPEARPPLAAPSTYLALGDSVAAGAGAGDGGGYVPLLADLLRDRLGCGREQAPGCPLELRQLAVGGATTSTLLRDQLPPALELLRSDADVRLVTVTVGGNDVFEPAVRACAPAPEAAGCRAGMTGAVAAADAGIDAVLGRLAEAAGSRTTVAVMTYYDPLPACRLAPLSALARRVLDGADGAPGLNGVLRARATQHGALVVETADRLHAPHDFVGGRDCLHPSPVGHARIAAAFDEAVGAAVAGG